MTAELPDLGERLRWLDDSTLQFGNTRLRLMAGLKAKASSDDEITLFKDRDFVRAYVQSLQDRDIRNMVEVGVKHGGSALFFWHLLQLQKLSCIELAGSAPALGNYIERMGLQDQIRLHFRIDQGDRDTVREIVAADFDGEAIDLVVDDASHIYSPSKATFETLFPLVKPGGLYILEDWRASLLAVHRSKEGDEEPPFHQLVHEILDFAIVNPHIMPQVSCYKNFAVVERGVGELPASGFDLSTPGAYFVPADKPLE